MNTAGRRFGSSGTVNVVGGGAVGVCSAVYLQRAGFAVRLIERGGLGDEASSGNAGLISADDCVPIGTPGVVWQVPGMLIDPLQPLAIRWRYLPRLSPWLLEFVRASRRERVEQISIALISLLRLAVASYLDLLSKEEADRFIQRTGVLYAYRTDRAFEEDHLGVALRRRRGVQLEEMDGKQVGELEPFLAGKCARGVFCPDSAFTPDPHGLIQVLGARFVAEGGEIVQTEALEVGFSDKGAVCVRTTDGEFSADTLVLAAGAWSRRLAAQLGANVPLDTERGYIAVLPRAERRPRVPFLAVDRHIAVTPMASGLRVAGTVEFAGLTAAPNLKRADALLEGVAPLIGPVDAHGVQRWMSFRPSMPDSLPVIGWAPGNRAFLAFGHGHLGLSLAAVTGRLVADALGGRRPTVDLTPFQPNRWVRNGSS